MRTLEGGHLNVSVIVMLGVVGDRYAAGHVVDTVALLNAMPLAGGDLIYFSDFVDPADAPYAGLAAEAGVHALDFSGLRQQEAGSGRFSTPDPVILRRCRGMILKSSFTECAASLETKTSGVACGRPAGFKTLSVTLRVSTSIA